MLLHFDCCQFHFLRQFFDKPVLATFPAGAVKGRQGFPLMLTDVVGNHVEFVHPDQGLGRRVIDTELCCSLGKLVVTSLMDDSSWTTYFRKLILVAAGILAYLFLRPCS